MALEMQGRHRQSPTMMISIDYSIRVGASDRARRSAASRIRDRSGIP